MTGDELLQHAADLGPEKGLKFLATHFNNGGRSPVEFLSALNKYQDATGTLRDDCPDDIRAICEAARRSLLGLP